MRIRTVDHSERRSTRRVWSVVAVLVIILLGFTLRRAITDAPNVASGATPDGFDRRYALHPLLAYLHIVPAVVYLVGAPLQLHRRFRQRHLTLHRRIGRGLLGAGVLAGAFAIVFGVRFAFDGPLEASASVVFGLYFLVALGRGLVAIRRRDVATHRRWMVRAFAIALAVGTIRIWVGLLAAAGVLSFRHSFGPAFWIAFLMHALAGEIYLGSRPTVHRSAAAPVVE